MKRGLTPRVFVSFPFCVPRAVEAELNVDATIQEHTKCRVVLRCSWNRDEAA